MTCSFKADLANIKQYSTNWVRKYFGMMRFRKEMKASEIDEACVTVSLWAGEPSLQGLLQQRPHLGTPALVTAGEDWEGPQLVLTWRLSWESRRKMSYGF